MNQLSVHTWFIIGLNLVLCVPLTFTVEIHNFVVDDFITASFAESEDNTFTETVANPISSLTGLLFVPLQTTLYSKLRELGRPEFIWKTGPTLPPLPRRH